jgi:hypothetical protein
MVVLNWIKDTLGQGSKRFLYSIGQGVGHVSSKIKNSLVNEQRALAEHYYNCHINFTSKLEDLTDKIKNFDSSASNSASYIEKKQQQLMFACLRMETALKTTAELKRERKEWERRSPTDSPIDILHPLVRLELINSELRTREQEFAVTDPNFVPQSSPASLTQEVEIITVTNQTDSKPQKTRSVTICHDCNPDSNSNDLPDEYLIKQAASIITELSTCRGDQNNAQEYQQKIAELRDLHTALKRSSRAQAHFRYRNALRNRLAKIFY